MNGKQIKKFVRHRRVAFLGSVDGEGFPNVKAVCAPRKIEGNDYYFLSNLSSARVAQWRENGNACLYFYRKGLFSYTGVIFVGRVEVVTEQTVKDELWRAGDKFIYKGGSSDPDYCVLKFTAERGRWYRDLKTANFSV